MTVPASDEEHEPPAEFFMFDDVLQPTGIDSDIGNQSLRSPVAHDAATPVRPIGNEYDSTPVEFFMQDEAVWASPSIPADDDAREGAVVRQTRSFAPSAPLYYDTGANWNSVPPIPSGVPTQGRAWSDCFGAACCACEYRWVNWRLGSDYLEGCMPEGYNGLPIIRATPTTALYSTPLKQGAVLETGSGGETSQQSAGLTRKHVTELNANISINPGDLPTQSSRAFADAQAAPTQLPGTHRGWNGMSCYWDASQLAHQPLYFEDVNLERGGYSYGIVQPVVSAARFFCRIPFLPYALAVHPHYEVQYALGEPRPGSPAPYQHIRPPLSTRGVLAEAAVVTGLFFAIP